MALDCESGSKRDYFYADAFIYWLFCGYFCLDCVHRFFQRKMRYVVCTAHGYDGKGCIKLRNLTLETWGFDILSPVWLNLGNKSSLVKVRERSLFWFYFLLHQPQRTLLPKPASCQVHCFTPHQTVTFKPWGKSLGHEWEIVVFILLFLTLFFSLPIFLSLHSLNQNTDPTDTMAQIPIKHVFHPK